MATARQLEANRRNAQRSTGPRTAEGKSIAKYNAFKHGLAANTILPHENPADYHEVRAALIETWQPANAQELMEIDNITMGWWCMQRSTRFEKRMFELQLQHMKTIHRAATTVPHPDDDGGIVASLCNRDNDKSYELLFRYDARAASRYYRALDHLMKLQTHRTRLQAAERKRLDHELASFREVPPDTVAPSPQSMEPAPEPPRCTSVRDCFGTKDLIESQASGVPTRHAKACATPQLTVLSSPAEAESSPHEENRA